MFSVFSAGCVLVLAAAAGAASAAAGGVDTIARAKYLWSQSPHGKMLERILPPSVEPGELPEPSSEGARLTARYCVQCHYLPSPQMHTAARWKTSVERMVWRMQGKGNMGTLMKEMMDHVEAPPEREVAVLTAYLQKHGQHEMDPAHPALKSEQGLRYGIACSQCHDAARSAPAHCAGVAGRGRADEAAHGVDEHGERPGCAEDDAGARYGGHRAFPAEQRTARKQAG